MAPRPPLDDDDEPPMPKMAMDEIQEVLAKDPVIPTPTPSPRIDHLPYKVSPLRSHPAVSFFS